MNIPIQSFVLYVEHIKLIEKLSDEQAGKLIKALFHYVAEYETPNFDDDIALDTVFEHIKHQVDWCTERYRKRITESERYI